MSKFTPKYAEVGGERGILEFFFKVSQKFLLVTQKPMQSFKIVAFLLLTDSGGYVKFTPKYTTVGGEGGVLEFLQRFHFYSFGN